MTGQTKEIILRTPEGSNLEYLTDNELGAGRIGTVYRGYAKSDTDFQQELAIKRSKDGFEKSFDANVQATRGQHIHHVIPFQFVGIEGKGNYINTAVMEYGGSNLKEVQERIRETLKKAEISPNVAKAFQYKVLYTVVDALQDAYRQNLCHGDLIPFNILCGFELKENMSGAELEERLINSEIRLCDRAGIKEAATAFTDDISSVYSKDAKFIGAFLDQNLKDVSLDGDLYSFFRLYSWLEEQAEHKSVHISAKKYLGLAITDDGDKTIYPSLEQIKDSLLAVIEKGGYFELVEVEKKNKQKYHQVQRPVDQFRTAWGGRSLISLTELQQLYTPPGVPPAGDSYQRFLTKGGTSLGAEEKEQMGQLLGEVVLHGVYKIAEEHGQIIKGRKLAADRQKVLDAELRGLRGNLDSLNSAYISSMANFKARESRFSSSPKQHTKDNADSLHQAIDQVRQASDSLYSQKSSLEQSIAEKETDLSQAKSHVKGFNPKPLEEALGFVIKTIHPALPKSYPAKFEDFIVTNKTLCMDVAAADEQVKLKMK